MAASTYAEEIAARMHKFVDFVHGNLKGDEKGEAQIYLDRFFQAFGHAGSREAGAVSEARIKRADRGTAFADLVWRPRVLPPVPGSQRGREPGGRSR